MDELLELIGQCVIVILFLALHVGLPILVLIALWNLAFG